MNIALSKSWPKAAVFSALFDIAGVVLVYLVPTLSHLFTIPLYMLEPMRCVLVLSLAHTHKWNAYGLALTLPLASFLLSGHPIPVKACLISAELALNVGLFFVFQKPLRSTTVALVASATCSKVGYYLGKLLAIRAGLIDGELFSTPFYWQGLTILICGLYFLAVELGTHMRQKEKRISASN
jgi:hypothetical protein